VDLGFSHFLAEEKGCRWKEEVDVKATTRWKGTVIAKQVFLPYGPTP